jgi:hypothetical protein
VDLDDRGLAEDRPLQVRQGGAGQAAIDVRERVAQLRPEPVGVALDEIAVGFRPDSPYSAIR